ncbi:MAG: bifunctional diaminohydroxyphosphoribosylaminopyrimidine deaminase/5-amino-6-(5-phosphoribosylamino)uracil reductase RibD [Bacteroidota bacterium]
MQSIDSFFLHRCTQLAQSATRAVYPNPYVGSVIVNENQIIGEGFHAYSGGPHAEVNAVRSVSQPDLLSSSTIYVSLEPCAHYGKTPPCADLIVQHKIPRVVIGMRDPNPKVDGGGIARLKAHGVEVVIAEDPTPFEALNKVFLTNLSAKRPFIVLKWAASADGYVAQTNAEGQAFPTPISGIQAKRYVHRLRAFHHGILVGKHTAAIDNPSLTTRHFHGLSPIRMVLDRQLQLPEALTLFQDGGETWVINALRDEAVGAIRYIKQDQWTDWRKWLENLYAQTHIASILIEGGPNTLQQLIDQDMWDEIHYIEAPQKLGQGIPAPTLSPDLSFSSREYLGDDLLTVYQRFPFPSQKEKDLSS